MKTIWQLTYETIPGNGEQAKKYKSFAEAKKGIREMISQIYISPCTEAIREDGTHKTYRAAMADFLDNYVSRTDFFNTNETLPSHKSEDYEYEKKITIKNDADEDVDDYDWYDDEEETDWLDDFSIYIDNSLISFEYHNGEVLRTNIISMTNEKETYYLDFFVDVRKAPKAKFTGVHMTLTPMQYWGTSAYPLMILRELERSQKPLDQQQIIAYIEAVYDTTVERKAIGRNISLLKDLGYDIQHNGAGYYISKKTSALEQNDFKTIVESINCNDALDDDRKRELIDKLFEM
jgi:hypothetical protein